jgi:outer membrane protein TolC
MKIQFLAFLIWPAMLATALAQDAPSAPRNRATLSLTLRDCYEMALRNNLDISIERIAPRITETSILSERAVFDPSLALNAVFQSSSRPLNASQSASALGLRSVRSQQIQTGLTLEGKAPTGLQYSVQATNNASGNTLNAFHDEYSAFAGLTVSQPLLKNLGFDNNLVGIRVARKNHEISMDVLTQRIMEAVSAAQKAYFDLVFARQELEVRRESLELAETLLKENKARLAAGVMSPLDVTEAEAAVAARREEVLVAERAAHDQENLLKRIISADVAALRNTTLVPVDTPLEKEIIVDTDVSLRDALEHRPDYLQAKKEVERRQLVVQFTRNQLLPQMDLQGSYGVNGLRREYWPAYSEALEWRNPQWSVGVVISIPLGAKRERANHAAAKLESERALLNLKRAEQNLFVEVDNAAAAVQTNFKRIAAAGEAKRLAEEKLAAEKKKLDAGTSTSFFVLQFQQDLARARANQLRAILDYNKSLIDLYYAEGTLLKRLGLQVLGD